MRKKERAPGDPIRKKRFRETARELLHMAKVKRQFGEAVDAAGTVARAMEQAYQLGFADALKESDLSPTADSKQIAVPASGDAMPWTLIPPRTRGTFWSICLASLGRTGRTESSSYLVPQNTRRQKQIWGLVVPDRQTFDKTVGDGTIVTLVRLGLLQHEDSEEPRVTLTAYGIRTWNRFCERGGHWPDDLVEKLP